MSFAYHDWQLDLGPYTGVAGETKTLVATPQVYYRVENILATDSATPAGSGTRVGKLIVGNKLQRPVVVGSTTTLFFTPGPGDSANYISWDMCPPGSQILAEVIFVLPCTFDLSFFGRARG